MKSTTGESFLSRLRRFLSVEVWRMDPRSLPRLKGLGISQLRVIIIVARSFVKEKLKLRAMALTFITLFSLVPILAVGLSMFKGLGGMEKVEQEYLPKAIGYLMGSAGGEATAGQSSEEVAKLEDRKKEIQEAIISYVKKVQGGAIGGVGVVFLLLSVVTLFANIEKAFNDIWGVKQERPFFQKVIYYLFVVIVCPVFAVTGATVSASLENQSVVAWTMKYVPGATAAIGILVPLLLIWIALFLLYKLMPFTEVRLKPAAIGSLVAAVAFLMAQWGYNDIMIGSFRKYDAVFSSLAAVPMAIIWIYFVWMIVLFGHSIVFANQQLHSYLWESEALGASPYDRELLALRIMKEVAAAFQAGEVAESSEVLAQRLDVPVRLVRDITHQLAQGKLLVRVAQGHRGGEGYVPALPPADLTLSRVIEVMRRRSDLELAQAGAAPAIAELLDRSTAASEKVLGEVSVASLTAAK